MFPPGGGVKVVKIDHNFIAIKDFSRFFEAFLNSSSETFFETFWMRHFLRYFEWDIFRDILSETFWVLHVEWDIFETI